MLPTQQQDRVGQLAESRADLPEDGSRNDASETWVLFSVDDQIYALDLWEVQRIVHAVQVKPLPEVPSYVAGVVDVSGRVLPVIDLRLRFDHPTRPVELDDHFIIAQSPTHGLVLPVDTTLGSREIPSDSIPPDSALPRCVRKVVPLEQGVVYSLDLERVLFGDEPPFDSRLAQILAELQGK